MRLPTFIRVFPKKKIVVHERSALKNSFSTYVCYAPDVLFWTVLYLSLLIWNGNMQLLIRIALLRMRRYNSILSSSAFFHIFSLLRFIAVLLLKYGVSINRRIMYDLCPYENAFQQKYGRKCYYWLSIMQGCVISISDLTKILTFTQPYTSLN